MAESERGGVFGATKWTRGNAPDRNLKCVDRVPNRACQHAAFRSEVSLRRAVRQVDGGGIRFSLRRRVPHDDNVSARSEGIDQCAPFQFLLRAGAERAQSDCNGRCAQEPADEMPSHFAFFGVSTTIEPFMLVWIVQWYAYVPGFVKV